jgi:hypothetical protein
LGEFLTGFAGCPHLWLREAPLLQFADSEINDVDRRLENVEKGNLDHKNTQFRWCVVTDSPLISESQIGDAEFEHKAKAVSSSARDTADRATSPCR